MSIQDNNFPVMTEEQLAHMLQIEVSALARMRKNGKGPKSFKAGSKVRYLRETVNEWIKNRQEIPHKEAI